MESFSFGTDFHGNRETIDTFLRESAERRTKHVVFGGDLAPKKMGLRFSDGAGAKFTHPSDLDRGNLQSGTQPSAKDLERRGYILFEAGLTVEDLLKLEVIIEKMNRLAANENTPEYFDETEIEFIERVVKPLMLEYFLENNYGQKAFENFAKNIPRYIVEAEGINTPPAFIYAFIVYIKIENLIKTQRISNSAQRNKLLFHREDSPESHFINAMQLKYKMGQSHYNQPVLNFCNYGTPPKQWAFLLRDLHNHSVAGQRAFVAEFLRKVAQFKDQAPGQPTVTAMLGNDDSGELIETMEDAERRGLIYYPHGKVVQVSPAVQILGYEHVPPMPYAHDFWYRDEKDIAADLAQLERKIRGDVRFCIADIHCPPSDTALAREEIDGELTDLGSTAVREFIEKAHPTVALTGHVHHAWKYGKRVKEKVGKTWVFNPGASEYYPRFIFGTLR